MASAADSFLDYVQPHLRRMYVAARQYVSGPDDAHDLVQEALLRSWRTFSRTDEKTYCRSWLFAVMRNVAWEWHRAASRRVTLVPTLNSELTEIASSDLAEPFPPWPLLDENEFRELLDERIAQALEALEPSFREVLILSAAGDLTYREIAEVLGCPVGTVMSRMARARRILRERLADFAGQRRRVQEGRP